MNPEIPKIKHPVRIIIEDSEVPQGQENDFIEQQVASQPSKKDHQEDNKVELVDITTEPWNKGTSTQTFRENIQKVNKY